MYVFSFCLYNEPNSFYYSGLLENIDLIHTHFPGWGIYVYIGNDVPDEFCQKLEQLGCTLRYTNVNGDLNMVQRYFAIDEPDVDIMIVRDADSRVHWKDRWAIQHFLKSSYIAHTIRDNPEHCARMMGGLWGMKKTQISIQELYNQYKQSAREYNGRGNDQLFLREQVYPKLTANMVVYYSHMEVLFPLEHAIKFPFQWSNDLYCGKN